MKIIAVALLLFIVIALLAGLSGLLNPKPYPQRTIRSLTLRISLSVGLFFLLVLGALCGWWRPHQL